MSEPEARVLVGVECGARLRVLSGGIARLVGVLSGFSANTMKESTLVQLCTLAASAIKEMAKDNRKNQDAITEAGAIPPLVALLSGGPDSVATEQAAEALRKLACGNTAGKAAIIEAGAIPPLVALLSPTAGDEEDKAKAIENAVGALFNLTCIDTASRSGSACRGCQPQ